MAIAKNNNPVLAGTRTAAQIIPVEGTALKTGITQLPFVLPVGPGVLEKRK